MAERVTVGVCGPVVVTLDGAVIKLGGGKARAIIATLAADAGRSVAAERVITVLWGDEAPSGAGATLQVHVSNLRKALVPAAQAVGITSLITTANGGYRLETSGVSCDLTEFEADLDRARTARRARRASDAVEGYRQALRWWRGAPPAELGATHAGTAIAARLAALRAAAVEERFDAELAAGHHGEVAGEIAAAVADDPLNETLRGLWMLALYRSGRQAEALAAYRVGRDELIEELGLEPGPALRALENAILSQDPSLALATAAPGRLASIGDDVLSTMIGTSVIAPDAWLTGPDGIPIALERAVTTLGRRADRGVIVDDTRASRAHCEIRRTMHGFRLLDSGSTNGTKHNGVPIGEVELVSGDVIVVGSTAFRFEQR